MGKFVRGNFVGGRHIDSSVVSVKSRGRMRKDRYNDHICGTEMACEAMCITGDGDVCIVAICHHHQKTHVLVPMMHRR